VAVGAQQLEVLDAVVQAVAVDVMDLETPSRFATSVTVNPSVSS
jgi:hypothetical protein